jgi:hypothetical protein
MVYPKKLIEHAQQSAQEGQIDAHSPFRLALCRDLEYRGIKIER